MFPSEGDGAYFARCFIERGCRIHVIIMRAAFEDLKPLGTKTAGKFRKVQMCNWSFMLWGGSYGGFRKQKKFISKTFHLYLYQKGIREVNISPLGEINIQWVTSRVRHTSVPFVLIRSQTSWLWFNWLRTSILDLEPTEFMRIGRMRTIASIKKALLPICLSVCLFINWKDH